MNTMQRVMANYEPMNETLITALVMKAKKGCIQSRNRLMTAFFPVLKRIAIQKCARSWEDLFQSSVVDFPTMLNSFDPEKGSLHTYLSYYLSNTMTNESVSMAGCMHTPMHHYHANRKMINENRVNNTDRPLPYPKRVDSFNAPIKNDEKKTIEDTLFDENDPDIETTITVQELVSSLPDIEQKIIKSIFYDQRTLEETKDELGLELSHVNNIKKLALKKLKKIIV